DTIPTSALQEDHVSMGWSACRKLRRAIDNLRSILAVELLAATHAVDLRAPLQPAAGTRAALQAVRDIVAGPGPDRWLAPDIAAVTDLLRRRAITAAVDAAGIELR
ncbi:MAG: aromatic amino acid lyase, partial [Acidimicrobiia bacterium]